LSFATTKTERGRLCLGDALGMIPPFTGHGMALALESAALTLPPLLAWSRGEGGWDDAVATAQRAIARRLASRVRLARSLHPWLLSPPRQRIFAWTQRAGLLPIRPLLRRLHA
jgi:2-polyprenyl-6-methoxyphenol hydroxylase-like FAD-dependent oxidoreductase